MSDSEDKELEKIMDALSKGATHLVASPRAIKKLQDRGVPIKEKFTSYEDYVDEVYEKRKKEAVGLLRQLPYVDRSIADSTIQAIYEEIRESLAFSNFIAVIVNSILLLEHAMRTRIYEERLKSDPKAQWEEMEKLDMDALIQQLKKFKLIDPEQYNALFSFSKELRNPYLHINFLKLLKDIMIGDIPGIDIETRKEKHEKDVEATKYRYLWFIAKRFFDKEMAIPVVNICVHFTNILLIQPEPDEPKKV